MQQLLDNINHCKLSLFFTGIEFGLSSKAINFAENKKELDKDEAIRVGYSRKELHSLYLYLILISRRK
jgi:hypothetical protein